MDDARRSTDTTSSARAPSEGAVSTNAKDGGTNGNSENFEKTRRMFEQQRSINSDKPAGNIGDNSGSYGKSPDIEFKETDEAITMRWKAVEDSQYYKIHLDRADEPITKTSQVANAEFKKTTYDWKIGESFPVSISVIDNSNQERDFIEKTYFVVGGSNAVCNIVAKQHDESPHCGLNIHWESARETPLSYEVVVIKKASGKQKQALSVEGNTTDFFDLRPCTEYYCTVTAKYENHALEKTAVSNIVKTLEAVVFLASQRADFDVAQAGKPTILECSATKDPVLRSKFTWRLADLEKESVNYKLSGVKATCKEGNKQRKQLTVKKDWCSAESIDLSHGKTYSFRVSCTYFNQSSRKTHEAIQERVVHTDIGKPVVENIFCRGREVVVEFHLADGAVGHTGIMKNADKKVVETVVVESPPTAKFSMTDTCSYGKKCAFEIIAKWENGTQTKHSKEVLLGGDRAITNVNIVKDKENPRRQVIVEWKEPKLKPQGYKLVLYEMHQQQDGEYNKTEAHKVPNLKKNHRSYRFIKLKSNVVYSCEVFPIYGEQAEGGTISNLIKTKERRSHATERMIRFGKPIQIAHDLKPGKSDDYTASLTWTPVDVGENFRVLNYHINVKQYRGYVIFDSTVIDCDCKSEDTNFLVPGITKGNKYKVKFKTIYQDLDTGCFKEATKDHEFSTVPRKTNIEKCNWKNDVVLFSWPAVDGAERYVLAIKDEFLKENLVPEYAVSGKEFKDKGNAQIPMTNKLSFGKVCMAKVTVYTDGGLTSESEFSKHLIGGDKVPRNVKAFTNDASPKRSIVINFDAPLESARTTYRVIAIPTSGRQKQKKFQKIPTVFKYLRSGMEYKFKVSALTKNHESEGSMSNSVRTAGGHSGRFALKFENSGTLNLSGANVEGINTNIIFHKPDNFGQVRDVQSEVSSESNEQDEVKFQFLAPSFGGKQDDYKVEKYDVKITNCHGQPKDSSEIKFLEDVHKYSTHFFSLQLGEKYNITIETLYEDIEADVVQRSAASKLTFCTRPRKPNVIANHVKSNMLRIAWNAVKGAERYHLEIFTKNSKNPHFARTMSTNTEWKQELNEEFGYGTTYYAIVTAYNDEKSNSFQTSQKTIGGDNVPRNVHASNLHEKITEPNTQIFLEWEAPKILPKTYEVEVIPSVPKRHAAIDGETGLVSGLKAGTLYYFKVFAIPENNDQMIRSEGCCSNKIRTDPKLGIPKNVTLALCEDSPCKSLKLKFNRADGNLTRHEAVLYEIISQEKLKVSQCAVEASGYNYTDLKPNTKYTVAIHGVFDNGTGENVESNQILTAPSAPNIWHCECADDPDKRSREFLLKWEPDEGCNTHQIRINRGSSVTAENLIVVNYQRELQYTCDYEAAQYFVQVSSKNDSGHFGKWSENAIVYLAPAKLENVFAKLADNGPNVIIQFDVPKRDSPLYHILAISDQKSVGVQAECQQNLGKNCVEFTVTDLPPAQTFKFKIWAENTAKTSGKETFSNEITSRPVKAVVKSLQRSDENPSTDIAIDWKSQEGCDSYEVMITAGGEQQCLSVSSTACTYRCKFPGEQCVVKVRAICKKVEGEWSNGHHIWLAPGEVKLLTKTWLRSEPVNFVEVKWLPLKVTPCGYHITLYLSKTEKIEHHSEPHENSYIFEEVLKAGSLCYCTIAAFNAEVTGKVTTSKCYQIAWTVPEYFIITPDNNDPSRRAKMSWDKPFGVNCFKLCIENNQTGVVITQELESTEENEQIYVFQSGIPGNSYAVRLHSGCDSRYALKYKKQPMVMKPEAPTDVTVSANRSANGIVVEYKDNTLLRKSYEVALEPTDDPGGKVTQTTKQNKVVFKDLIPGQSYSVSVVTIIEGDRSKTVFVDGFVYTFPAEVRNLTSRYENDDVNFEWDSLEIAPEKYIVQWRINNDPVIEDKTQKTNFSIHFAKPAHCYSARVKACNGSGCGPCTDWKTFITDPLPPREITVQKHKDFPETCLIVRFHDEDDPLKSYLVTACDPAGALKVEPTKEHYAILSELQPGISYTISVQTIFCGKRSIPRPYFSI